MISIVTPVKDHANLIPEYEAAVNGADVVIVDNASEPAAAQAWRMMCSRLGAQYIRNERNQWFSAACNQGYARTMGEVIIFLNNDIKAEPGWLAHVAQQVRPGALYGPAIDMKVVNRQPLIYIEGWCIAGWREDWERIRGQRTHELTEAHPLKPYVPSLWNPAEGPWDALTYARPYWDDVDLSWRSARLGLGLRKLFVPIEHLGNTTSATTPGAYRHADTNGGDGGNRRAFERRMKQHQEGTLC